MRRTTINSIHIMIVMALSMPFTSLANASTSRGCIAIFQGTKPISVEVDLPNFEGGLFQTAQFRFTNLPQNMVPDDKGRYCYPSEDKRFEFVHIYYYAMKEIEDYNLIFSS